MLRAMWGSDSHQWSSSSGYQESRDWNKGKQQWSSSSNAWWGSKSATTPTVPAAKPVIPANFKSDDKFFDSAAVGSGNHQSTESSNRLIGLGKHRCGTTSG